MPRAQEIITQSIVKAVMMMKEEETKCQCHCCSPGPLQLGLSCLQGSHIDFLHVLQVGVKNKRETSIHTVRAICVRETANTQLVQKVCTFSSLGNSPPSTGSLHATNYSFYSGLKEL